MAHRVADGGGGGLSLRTGLLLRHILQAHHRRRDAHYTDQPRRDGKNARVGPAGHCPPRSPGLRCLGPSPGRLQSRLRRGGKQGGGSQGLVLLHRGTLREAMEVQIDQMVSR